MLVVLHHLSALIPWQPQGLVDLGMAFLFVLVGFLIPLRYEQLRGGWSVVAFLWKQLSGILPLHLVTFLLSIPLFLALAGHISFSIGLQNVFLLQSWSGSLGVVFSFNSVSCWFLSSLVFCFLVISLVLTRPRILFPLAFAGSLVSVLLSALYIQQQIPPDTNLIAWLIYIFPPNRLFNVLCGMGAGYLFLMLPRPGTGRGSTIVWTAVELVVLSFFVERIVSQGFTKAAFNYFFPMVPWVSLTANHLFENYLMCPVLSIGLLIVFGLHGGCISKLLSTRPLAVLGRASFSLYMVHQLLFLFLSFAKEPFVAHVGEIGFALSACVLAILTAFIFLVLIEKPGRKILVYSLFRREIPLI